MIVRHYDHSDAVALTPIHNAVYPDEPRMTASFQQHTASLEQAGGNAWVVEAKGEVVGYAAVTPIPGLDGILGLEGFIAPAYRRQGLGSRLLLYVIQELEQSGAGQLSHYVTTVDAPAAHFLRHHGFFIEHEEWVMVLPELTHLPPLLPPTGCHLQTFNRSQAIQYFCSLYDQSFSNHRWYQPYSHAEVAATLDGAADILFLVCAFRPVGFVWTRMAESGAGEIEPLGVAKPYQGRGYGRFLLLAGLHRLKERGAQKVALGAWRDNKAALHLYQSLGFQHAYTRTYLAYDL
ncbi:MAG TPA: GNAT family N-acetyltransferase [Anaerolineae bacterium]